jgi:hypothetical protein
MGTSFLEYLPQRNAKSPRLATCRLWTASGPAVPGKCVSKQKHEDTKQG